MNSNLETLKKIKLIPENTKVRLNVAKIKSQKDYDKLSTRYKSWVEQHAKDVLTVIYDERHRNNPVLISFKEDETNPKWLFFVGDLIIV